MKWHKYSDTFYTCGDFSIELFDVGGAPRWEVYAQTRVQIDPKPWNAQTAYKVVYELIGFAPTLAEAKAIAALNNAQEK